MAEIYEWLEDVDYPMNGTFAEYESMDQIMPFDIDENGNVYFYMSHAWDARFEHQIDVESLPIDLSLTMTGSSASSSLGQIFVIVLEKFIDVNRKILIYFARVIEIPESLEKPIENANFTMEELEILESIVEENLESISPSVINGQ